PPQTPPSAPGSTTRRAFQGAGKLWPTKTAPSTTFVTHGQHVATPHPPLLTLLDEYVSLNGRHATYVFPHVNMACATTTTFRKRHEKNPATTRTSEKSTIRAPPKFHSNTNNELTGSTAAVGTNQKMIGSHPPNLKLTAHDHASTPDASTLACV
ncbi:unnamed protein product, partial [Ectocarpus sp. 12 AP-2014]